MAEYIEREAIRNALYDADAITMNGVAILNNFPAADVVKVVRCWECKHFPKGVIADFCRRKPNGDAVMSDDFCSYGERREGE